MVTIPTIYGDDWGMLYEIVLPTLESIDTFPGFQPPFSSRLSELQLLQRPVSSFGAFLEWRYPKNLWFINVCNGKSSSNG